jgi:hypothetical protein
VIDDDGMGDYDLIGECVTNIGTIMGSRAQTLQAELKNPAKPNAKNLGTIFIHAESLQESNDMVAWQIAGTNLKNKGCCEVLPIHYFVQR